MRTDKTGSVQLKKETSKVDIIEVYKILNSVKKVNKEVLFTASCNTRTRDHPMKIAGIITDLIKYYFTQQTVNPWSLLP